MAKPAINAGFQTSKMMDYHQILKGNPGKPAEMVNFPLPGLPEGNMADVLISRSIT